MTSGTDWHWALYVGAGIGVLLMGIGILVVCSALAATLKRVNVTLDEVDRQIAALGAPVAATLSHVGGIADTADTTVARLSGVVGSLESVAGGVAKTTNLVGEAVQPAIVDLGATLTGITAGIRRFVTGRRGESTGG